MENNDLEEKPLDSNKHPKQDFQVERLAFFSDAVFAIAITLLVIEFKVPRINSDTAFDDVVKQLWDLKYLFLATLLSFLLIASYWRHHHRLFKYIHNYNGKIITINMLMLLPIIFFPFTTAFLAESFNSLFANGKVNLNTYFLGLRLFLINNFLASLMCYIFYWYAILKHKELSYAMPEKEKFDSISGILFGLSIFGIITIATFIIKENVIGLNIIGLAMWIAIIVWVMIKRKYKKKFAEK